MRFYVYAKQLYGTRTKKFTGTHVKISDVKIPELDEAGFSRHNVEGDMARWSKLVISVGDCGDGTSVIPQTTNQLIAKITGRPEPLNRDPEWELKINKETANVSN